MTNDRTVKQWGRWIAAGAILVGGVSARGAETLNELLPQDTLAFVEISPAEPAGTKDAGSASGLLDVGLDAMQSFGLLPRNAGLAADVLGLIGVAGTQRTCLAWLDADLRVTPVNELECNSAQFVWLIDTHGDSQGMITHLTNLLSHLATRSTAQQHLRETAEHHVQYVEFHDSSWPEWMVLSWLQRGDTFVLAVGPGAMDHYLSDASVGGVPWLPTLKAVDAAAAKIGAHGETVVRGYAALKAFEDRFPEATRAPLPRALLDNLHLRGGNAATLAVRAQGRALSIDETTLTDRPVSPTLWTRSLAADSPLLKLVPAEATAYLALNIEWADLYGRVVRIVDACLPADDSASQIINDFSTQRHVDIVRDILSKFDSTVVVHDAPLHPLRLPLMITGVCSVAPADAAGVRYAMNALVSGATEALDHRAARHGQGAAVDPSQDFSHLRIRSEADGVTYLQFGLVGPGWTWVNNRLLFSWSPAAVRYNVPIVHDAPAEAAVAGSSGH